MKAKRSTEPRITNSPMPTLKELARMEKARLYLLREYGITPVQPPWWNTEKFGLYPLRLLDPADRPAPLPELEPQEEEPQEEDPQPRLFD